MQKISSLLRSLENNPQFEGIVFSETDDFRWDHTTKTISYSTKGADAPFYLLHEAGHAALHHTEYPDDMTLIAMERAAWDEATTLGQLTGVIPPLDLVEDSIDSYRDWLHARSTCPNCSSTGIQISSNTYQCMACRQRWQVNEARSCALRRYAL